MRVAIGPLARTGLEQKAGSDLTASVNAALVYFMKKMANGRAVASFPGFLPPVGGDGAVEIEIDAELAAELAREATELKTTVPELALHAVLVYLAELDLISGKRNSCEGRRRR